MLWLAAISAFLIGGISGGAFIYFLKLKNNGNITGELNDFQLRNVELQTIIESLQRQQESETKLLKNSFEQEKNILLEKHAQEVRLLTEQFERSRGEMEKNHQDRLEQVRKEISILKKSIEHERKILAEKHANEIKLLSEQFERTSAEIKNTHQARLDQLKEEFKVLSDKILEEKTGKLQNSNKEQLENLLNPLKEKMGEFKNAVEDSKNKGIELNSALTSQLNKMMEETNRIGGEARSLVCALKGEQKTQGDWGEMILEDILQRSGLFRGVHYECQETLRDEGGKVITGECEHKMRPDVIVHYPDGKDVIIDSKVSLTAYTEYMNAENETIRQEALDRHILSVRNHVKELKKKNYTVYNSKSGRDTVDFVLMFIPNEGPFHLAMLSVPTLWNEAFQEKVLIVSPTNLMALLKIIHIAWTREEQSRNQQEILKTAAELLDRLYSFYEDFDSIGTQLSRVQKAYDEATNRLKQGTRNHSVVLSGEKLKQLGVRMTKQKKMPPALNTMENLSLEDGMENAPDETVSEQEQ